MPTSPFQLGGLYTGAAPKKRPQSALGLGAPVVASPLNRPKPYGRITSENFQALRSGGGAPATNVPPSGPPPVPQPQAGGGGRGGWNPYQRCRPMLNPICRALEPCYDPNWIRLSAGTDTCGRPDGTFLFLESYRNPYVYHCAYNRPCPTLPVRPPGPPPIGIGDTKPPPPPGPCPHGQILSRFIPYAGPGRCPAQAGAQPSPVHKCGYHQCDKIPRYTWRPPEDQVKRCCYWRR